MKIFVSGMWNYTEGSLGAQALSEGLLTQVKATYPDAAIFTAPQIKTRYFPTRLLKIKILSKIFKRQFRAYFEYIYKKKYPQYVNEIKNSDLVLISGDGILTDIFPMSALQLATEMRLAQLYSVPNASLNQSANFEIGGFVDYLFQDTFMKSPVQLREQTSFDFVRKMPNNSNIKIEQGIDTAFLTERLSSAEKTYYDNALLSPLLKKYGIIGDNFICIGVRANRPKGQKIELQYWAEFLNYVDKITDNKLLYVSTANHLDKINGIKLRDQIPGMVVPNEFDDYGKYNYRVIERLIERSSFSISDRYHQNVFALLTDTPFLAFEANTIKTQGLIDTMGYEGEIQKLPNKQNIGDLKASFIKAWSNRHITNFDMVKKNIVDKNTYSSFIKDV